MKIVKKGVAGTMQSSDLMVFVEPADSLKVEIESGRSTLGVYPPNEETLARYAEWRKARTAVG